MELSNNFIVLSPYKGKSKFRFWHDLKVGDIVKISIPIRRYNPDLTIAVGPNNKFTCSPGVFNQYLEKIELKQEN